MSKRFVLVMCFLWSLLLASTASADLVGHWAFDEGSGTTVADQAGGIGEGVFTGGISWIPGISGKALELSGGGGEYVTFPNTPQSQLRSTGTYTVAAWVRVDKIDNGVIVMVGRGCSTWASWFLGVGGCEPDTGRSEGNLVFGIRTAGGAGFTGVETPLEPNTWVHATATYDGTTLVLYQDGTEVARTAAGLPYQNGDAFYLGADPGCNGRQWFGGAIDDLRIYDEALPEVDIRAIVLGSPGMASAPYPEDEAIDVPRDTVLGWIPGDYAATHDVYFGTVFDDVNDASRANPMGVLVSQGQAAATYDPPTRLEFSETYYWRVDEVNAAPDNTIFKGQTWSFTVEPFAYAIENVVATSNTTSTADQGPENTVNGSGLNANDQHSTNTTDMWVGTPIAGEVPYIQFEFDGVYKLHEMLVWNYNMAFEMFLGMGVKNATVEYSENGTDWTVLGDVVLNQAPGTITYTANTIVPLQGVAAKYVRLSIGSSWVSTTMHALSEVRFMYLPVKAREPQPADGAVDVALDAILSWRAGREAASHEVYLGTDPNALALAGTTVQASYNPGGLDLGVTQYWQVVEVNNTETTARWASDTWSFSTQEYVVVDDFEAYTDDWEAGEAIWQTWIDGWGDNANGSQVGYATSPFAEETIVHSDDQAMPFFYNNPTASASSEGNLTLASPQNWTASGIKSLSLWFYGASDNTGRVYVKVNGSKVPYDGDATDIAKTQWQPWNIDLSTVGGNLSSVTTLAFGVEGAGSGVVYVDDIRLYPKEPQTAMPIEPDVANLLALYAFEGDLKDSVGSFDGTASSAGALVANDAVRGSVLSVDGFGAGVDIPLIAEGNDVTICMWAKSDVDLVGVEYASFFHSRGWEPGDIHYRYQWGSVNAGVNGIAGGNLAGSGIVLPDQWNHVALTISETALVVWLNGYPEATRTLSSGVTLTLGDGMIGAWRDAAGTVSRGFTGQLDDVRIYNRALTQAELAGLAGRTNPIHVPF